MSPTFKHKEQSTSKIGNLHIKNSLSGKLLGINFDQILKNVSKEMVLSLFAIKMSNF